MAEIVKEIFSLDFDTSKAKSNVLLLADDVDKLDKKVGTAKKGTTEYTSAVNELSAKKKELNTVLNQETTTINGLNAKVQVLESVVNKATIGSDKWHQATKRLNEAQTQLTKATGEAHQSVDSFGDTLKKGGEALLEFLAVEKIIEFGKQSVEAFAEAEKAVTLLGFAIKKISGESAESLNLLLNQSKELGENGVFSHKEVEQAQLFLVQLGLNSKEVEKFIPLLADFAAGTGQNLQSAVETAARAIEGQTRGLRQYGAEFKDTGDKAENFSILQQKLSKYLGSNEVVLGTTEGKMKALKIATEDFAEKASGQLVDVLTRIIQPFKDLSDASANLKKSLGELNETESDGQKFLKGDAEERKKLSDNYTRLNVILQKTVDKRKEELILAGKTGNSGVNDAARANLNLAEKALEANKAQVALFQQINSETGKTKLGLTDQEIQKRQEEAKKQAAEQLKLRKELTDASVGLIEDERDRERAKVTVSFQDKISQIKGNSLIEVELRKALRGQMQRELDDLDEKYRKKDEEKNKKDFEDALKEAEEIAKQANENAKRQQESSKKLREDAFKHDLSAAKDIADNPERTLSERFKAIDKERDLLLQEANNKIKIGEATEEDLVRITKDAELKKQKLQRETFDKYLTATKNLVDEAFKGVNAINQAAITAADADIKRQEVQVTKAKEIAATGNAEILEKEEERLNKLNELKAKYVRQQQALAVVELVANSVVAVAKSANEPFPLNLIAITATLIALGAGIAKAKALASEAAFAEGVIDLQGPGTETSDSIHARLSKGESVMTAQETKDFKPTLEAIRKGYIDPKLLNSIASRQLDRMLSIPEATLELSNQMNVGNLEGKLDDLQQAILGLPKEIGKTVTVQTLNITEKGIYTTVKSVERKNNEVNKRAR